MNIACKVKFYGSVFFYLCIKLPNSGSLNALNVYRDGGPSGHCVIGGGSQ
jgi:hypothetical protein